MSDAAQVVESITTSGATLELVSGKLIYTPPPGSGPEVKAAHLALLRPDKAAILAYLEAAATPKPVLTAPVAACGSTECAGCYEISPGVMLHPPREFDPAYLAWRSRLAEYGKGRKR